MNSSRRFPFSTALVASAVVAGFVAGWLSAPGENSSPANRIPRQPATAESPANEPLGASVATAPQSATLRPARDWIPSALATAPRSLADALAENDELRRTYLLEEWAATAPLATLPGALEEIRSHPNPNVQSSALGPLFARWAALAPESALAVAITLPPAHEHPARRAGIMAWTKLNPEAAFAWLQHSPAVVARDPFSSGYNEFVEALVESGRLAEAASFVPRMGGDTHVGFAQARVATLLARQDPAAALSWFETLPPGQARVSTFNNLISGLAQQDPELALRSALANESTAERKSGITAATTTWAKRDLTAATDWLLARRSDPEMQGAMATVATAQGAAHPEVTLRLLDAVTDPNQRHNAVARLTPRLGAEDPARGADLVLRYALPNARTELLQRVLKTWAAKDPAAARTFIASDPRLSSEQRSALQSAFPSKP